MILKLKHGPANMVGPAEARTDCWLYLNYFPPRLPWGVAAAAHGDSGEAEEESSLRRTPCCPAPVQPVHARPSSSRGQLSGQAVCLRSLRAVNLESVLLSIYCLDLTSLTFKTRRINVLTNYQ